MLTKLFDTLANMGIWIRLNDSRTEPPKEEGRKWGAEAGGFALSLAEHGPEALSVLIKNLSGEEKRVELPGWLGYFQIEMDAPLRPFGKKVLEDPKLRILTERRFEAGKYLATEIPVSALYELAPGVSYAVRVWCAAPGGAADVRLVSNTVTLGKK